MTISEEILKKLETDRAFRLGLAIEIGLSERQVQNLIINHRKGKSVRLRDHFAVEFYKKNGFTEDKIFEKEKIK